MQNSIWNHEQTSPIASNYFSFQEPKECVRVRLDLALLTWESYAHNDNYQCES